MPPPEPGLRLPRTVTPSRYELTVEPDLDAARFSGFESIDITVTEPVTEIVLHAAELSIEEAWVETGGERRDATVALDADAELATLTVDSPVAPGAHQLHLRFEGALNDQLRGFYRSSFTAPDGTIQPIAVTQFEAPHARRAFPCWDEPDRKAVFGVTLVVAEGLLALSNGAEVSAEPVGAGRTAVRFADTIPMSTYLVAFVVGPLEVTSPVDVDGTALRVAYAPGAGHLSAYALEVGSFALRRLADYYAIPYPGGKLDLVAVPDFAFGAMENLGCVTFREVLLLVDPERSTQPELQLVVDVVAHELAHMWFGDLVTMRWWNGIWLNEAFATFMEMLVTDAFRPDWDRWTTFGIARSAAFDTDALSTTRPVEYEVRTPADAEGMFDVLTYEKGAAVVRMLEQYLGADRFREGIRSYLKSHAYGNTETTDLWDAIEAATGEPVRRTMDSWIFRPGYPIVSVELVDGGRRVRLRQERFRYEPVDGNDDDGERRSASGGAAPAGLRGRGTPETWAVPVLLRSPHGWHRVLLEGPGTEVELDGPVDWVLVNSGGSGFYRVRYAPDALRALAGRAQAELSPLERYGLVDDAWASVVAGVAPVADFVTLARAFSTETDLSVWERLVAALGSISRLVEPADRSAFEVLVRTLLGPALDRLGHEPDGAEPDRVSTLRATLFEALGVLGADEAVLRRATTVDRAAAADPATVDPALADAAVRVVAAGGDAATFDDLLDRSKKAATPQDALRYLRALADFEDPDLFDRLCALTLTDDVRTQDAPYLLRRAVTNRVNGRRAWTFLVERWDEVTARFPDNSIPRLLEGIRTLTEADLATEVEAFLTAHPPRQGAQSVAQHQERMRVNVVLRQREAAAIGEALR